MLNNISTQLPTFTEKHFNHPCPQCNKQRTFKSKDGVRRAIKANTSCSDCGNKNRSLKFSRSRHNAPCPMCKKTRYLRTAVELQYALDNNTHCQKCSGKVRSEKAKLNPKPKKIRPQIEESNKTIYISNCFICEKELRYTNKYNYDKSVKNNSKCNSCAIKKSWEFREKKKMPKGGYVRNCPECNAETIYKDSDRFNYCNKRNSLCWNCSRKKTKNSKAKGRSLYEFWIKEYGIEIGTQKINSYKAKKKISNSGKNNPNFGRAPRSMGRGWSGWYKGTLFRSLLELSYMVFLDSNNIKWESAENSKYTIPYFDKINKKNRNYLPDFIINENTIVEVKPKCYHLNEDVVMKSEAAKEWCKLKGLKFEILEPTKQLTQLEIYNLYKKELVTWTKNCAKKIGFKRFAEKYNINIKDILIDTDNT